MRKHEQRFFLGLTPLRNEALFFLLLLLLLLEHHIHILQCMKSERLNNCLKWRTGEGEGGPNKEKKDRLEKALWAKPKNTHTSTPDSINTQPALTFDNSATLQLPPWGKHSVEVLGESQSAWIHRQTSSSVLEGEKKKHRM